MQRPDAPAAPVPAWQENAAKFLEQAETLAAAMSLRPLTPEESERGVDLIFELLKYQHALSQIVERLRKPNGVITEDWYFEAVGAADALSRLALIETGERRA